MQDLVIDGVNLTFLPLRLAGIEAKIHSPDWSKGLFIEEGPGEHEFDKFLGGLSVSILLPEAWAAEAGEAGAVAAAAEGTEAGLSGAVEGAEAAGDLSGGEVSMADATTEEGAIDVFRRGDPKILDQTGISIKNLKIALGRAGLLDSSKASLVEATAKEAAEAGPGIMGWVTETGPGQVLTDLRGRPIIKLTQEGLSSYEEAVTTVGHELKHIQDIRSGAGMSEETAEAFGREYFERFVKWVKVLYMLKFSCLHIINISI